MIHWPDTFQQNGFNNMTFKGCSHKKALLYDKKNPIIMFLFSHPFSAFSHVMVAITPLLSDSALRDSHSATWYQTILFGDWELFTLKDYTKCLSAVWKSMRKPEWFTYTGIWDWKNSYVKAMTNYFSGP